MPARFIPFIGFRCRHDLRDRPHGRRLALPTAASKSSYRLGSEQFRPLPLAQALAIGGASDARASRLDRDPREKVSQLFDTLDPLPIRRRIWPEPRRNSSSAGRVNCRKANPSKSSFTFRPAKLPTSLRRGDAFSSYFRYSTDRLVLDLRGLFHIGRWSLLIGMSFSPAVWFLASSWPAVSRMGTSIASSMTG